MTINATAEQLAAVYCRFSLVKAGTAKEDVVQLGAWWFSLV